jgi:hypothetical protein
VQIVKITKSGTLRVFKPLACCEKKKVVMAEISLQDALALAPGGKHASLSCILETNIERAIFTRGQENCSLRVDITQPAPCVPDDVCAICLAKLGDAPALESCCGCYARKFEKCEHWVHVSCQINTKNSHNMLRCPVCRTEQASEAWVATRVRDYHLSNQRVAGT